MCKEVTGNSGLRGWGFKGSRFEGRGQGAFKGLRGCQESKRCSVEEAGPRPLRKIGV